MLDAFQRHAPGVPVMEVDGSDTGGVMAAAVRAAASMDQFADYADRGRRFADAVREHLGGGAGDDDPTSRTPEQPGPDPAA